MKLSVILPVYNGEKTLAQTLESLYNQSYKDFELIACVDGSTDNSLTILKAYQNKFNSFVILINEKNLGLGLTMNRLVSNCQGDYIAVAEQDDYYYPDRFSLQINILNENKNIGMVSGIADFWNGENINFRFPGILVNGGQYPTGLEMFLLNYKHQIKVANSCMMFRKAIHLNNGLYFSKHYPSVSVDWSYVLRFCLFSDIYGINQSLVKLDRRANRNSVTSNKIKQNKAARELIRSFYYEYPHIIKKKDYIFAMTTQHLLELGGINKYKLPWQFLKYFLKNPIDSRWLDYIKKRIKI
jgi:glycosyltransferase involved in cell wall biosynthesis